MADTDLWALTHRQRAAVADMLDGLSPDQWEQLTLCSGWRVRDLAAHMIATAHTTPRSFLLGLTKAGFHFSVYAERQVAKRRDQTPGKLVDGLRKTTTMTAHPPGPAQTPLSEILVHGADIARPLGVPYAPPEEALVAVAEFYKGAQPLIGAKRRVAGLRLVGTDTDWRTGDGPEVRGPTLSLLLAMAGRHAGLDGLQGDGFGTLLGRMP
jgi:uncharacterized protein (TIGR03083 family)